VVTVKLGLGALRSALATTAIILAPLAPVWSDDGSGHTDLRAELSHAVDMTCISELVYDFHMFAFDTLDLAIADHSDALQEALENEEFLLESREARMEQRLGLRIRGLELGLVAVSQSDPKLAIAAYAETETSWTFAEYRWSDDLGGWVLVGETYPLPPHACGLVD
jgi:hypothetical protein